MAKIKITDLPRNQKISEKEMKVISGGFTSMALSDEIKNVEAQQETVRNMRQTTTTAFQNFDQKSNQMYNMLSSVMKSMNEMRMGTIRNML